MTHVSSSSYDTGNSIPTFFAGAKPSLGLRRRTHANLNLNLNLILNPEATKPPTLNP